MFVVHDIVGCCLIRELDKGATNRSGGSGSCGSSLGGTRSGVTRVVVVETSWLDQLVWNIRQAGEETACDEWTNDQDDEENEQREEHDSVADDATSSELRLLERIDWRADLTTRGSVS